VFTQIAHVSIVVKDYKPTYTGVLNQPLSNFITTTSIVILQSWRYINHFRSDTPILKVLLARFQPLESPST
jgi:hypothetical protein